MKKIIPILISTIISCSDDDTSNQDPESNALTLKSVVTYSVSNGISTKFSSVNFVDGKRDVDSIFGSGESVAKWSYNDNGVLSNFQQKDFSDNLIYNSDFSYDDQNRIQSYQETDSENVVFVTSVNYDGDTIDLIKSDGSGSSLETTFTTNENGLIYTKDTQQGVNVNSLTFDGNNVTQAIINNTLEINFEYGESTEMAVQYLNRLRNSFDDNLNNYVIWRTNLEDIYDIYNDAYLTKESGSDIITYEYVFDDGLPINRKIYVADDESSTPELIYEERIDYE